MPALYRCDRQADALQAFDDARRALVEELGIEPGERLRQLQRMVLDHDAALAAPAEAVRAAPEARPRAEPPDAAAARRRVTVVVADLADADALAEQLDPESLDAVLERFAGACGAVLEEHGAAVDRGAGEAITGVFGLRARREDDPCARRVPRSSCATSSWRSRMRSKASRAGGRRSGSASRPGRSLSAPARAPAARRCTSQRRSGGPRRPAGS